MRRKAINLVVFMILASSVFMESAISAGADFRANYLYHLSNFSGPIPYQWPNLFVDQAASEIYVIDRERGGITVFNETGMEIYHFGDGNELGWIADGAVDGAGNILLLSQKHIVRCNYRGEPLDEIAFKNFPPDYSAFSPVRFVFRDDRFYLADLGAMRIVVTDNTGLFLKGYDVVSLLRDQGMKEKDEKDTDTGLFGFSVDQKGNLLCTIPGLFSAFRISPDGSVTGFGSKGSGPGKFGVVSGIVSDDRGYYYVSDRLRCMVVVFDNDLKFKGEFGHRGYRKENLIAPNDLAVDRENRVYVAQAARRGVSVFRVGDPTEDAGGRLLSTKSKGGDPPKDSENGFAHETSMGRNLPARAGGDNRPPTKVNPS